MRRFCGLWQRAAAGELSSWETSDDGALALVIVLDQFPRNMFRGDARAFATDARALAAAERMVARGWDAQLAPIERSFGYLPYEHAEDLAMQERSLELFNRLADETGSADAV